MSGAGPRKVLAGKLDAELEVGDGVGGHQQLEAENAGEQLLSHIGGPLAGVALSHELVANVSDDGVEEAAGSAGRIEDENAGVPAGVGTPALQAVSARPAGQWKRVRRRWSTERTM